MLECSDEYISPVPKKTVRFGGTVANVLLTYKQGNTSDFDLLKHQLSDPDIKDAQILNWLQELRGSVMLLTKDFEQLVSIVLKLPWLNRSKEVVEEYLAFLGNLVSAQTVYLRACLIMVASNFIPPRVLIQDGDVNISDSEDEDSLPENFNACHRALHIIARYVPSAPRFLVPILYEKFPFINKSPRTLVSYVHNVLRITVYFPTLRMEILELVTEKLLKMDLLIAIFVVVAPDFSVCYWPANTNIVHQPPTPEEGAQINLCSLTGTSVVMWFMMIILGTPYYPSEPTLPKALRSAYSKQTDEHRREAPVYKVGDKVWLSTKNLNIKVSASRQEIEETEETTRNDDMKTSSETEEGLFNMDEDEEMHDSKNGALCHTMRHPIAERLDMLMSVMFSYIRDICYVNGELSLEKTKDLYRDLLAVFDKLILPTHASCHVQYFMFYICSFKLGFAESFLEHLWKKLQNPNNPAVIRQTAASYIGSFLARAKFIPVVTVKACLDLLVNWLHTYISNQDAGNKSFCDVAFHGPFYSACQAVFYTFVFRHKQILDGNLRKGLTYLQNLNFDRIVMCQLNPLKICLPVVVNLFAGITRKYQLVFCYTIIERNSRQLIPVVRSSSGGDYVQTCINPLDSFFPFDPFLLKRSKKAIDPLYQIWEDSCTEDLPDIQKPIGKNTTAEEDDDFLKSETPQNDSLVGITPSSYDSQLRSPTSSVGSPTVTYLQRTL